MLLAAAAVGTGPAAGAECPLGPERYRAGWGARDAAAADLDGADGPDVVTANVFDRSVTVLLSDGLGGFAPAVEHPVGGQPKGVAAADFDGDGWADVVAVGGSLELLRNLGDGSLAAPVEIAPEPGEHVVAADLDGANGPDVVALDFRGVLRVVLNQGGGVFAPPQVVLSLTEGRGLAAADLDADGSPDLVVVDRAEGLVVLRGAGDGSFSEVERHALGEQPGRVLLADLIGDGAWDAVVTDRGAAEIALAEGVGDGRFRPPRSVPTAAPSLAAAAADLDGDGRRDLALVHQDDLVSWLRGVAGDAWEPGGLLAHPDRPSDVLVLELDGANGPELVVSAEGSSDVSVWLSEGGGSYPGGPPAPRHPTGAGPHSLRAADLGGSSALDLVTTNATRDVSVLVGRGDGSFAPERRWRNGAFPRSVAGGDFDGDGDEDLAVAQSDSDRVSVAANRGDGSFERELSHPVGELPWAVLTADVDGDGPLDLVVANYGSDDLSILLGRGDGSFLAETRVPSGRGPRWLAAGELDGTGGLDLAVAATFDEEVVVLLGDGTGGFAEGARLPTGGQPRSVAIADLDGDGWPEVLATVEDELLVHPNVAGVLGAPDRYLHPGGLGNGLGVADVTGDGLLDVVVGDGGNTRDLFAWEGLGDGTLGARTQSEAGVSFDSHLVVAELDGAGGPDAALISDSARSVVVHAGDGAGSFGPGSFHPVGDDARAIHAGDLNGDGRLDLATANRDSDDVSILLADGAGGFADERRALTCDDPLDAAALDLDGSPPVDLVLANGRCGDLVFLRAEGDGTLTELERLALGPADPAVTTLRAIEAADVDGDAVTDLLVLDRSAAELLLLLGEAAGGFGAPSRHPIGTSATALAIADLDGASGPDAVVANTGSSDLSVLLNDGAGGFLAEQRVPLPGRPQGLAVADLDGATGPDLLATVDLSLVVLPNDGAGGFPSSELHELGGGGRGVAVAELDAEPGPDAVVALAERGEIAILLGDGAGGFQSPLRLAGGDQPRAVVVAELATGFDVAAANYWGHDVSVFLDCFEAAPSWLLRDDSITALRPVTPPLASVLGEGLLLEGPDGVPDEGEGPDPTQPGSDDDDHAYALEPSAEWIDPDPSVGSDPGRPLVIYRLSGPGELRVERTPGGGVRISH